MNYLQIPIPTDSLYKFMAISGTILLPISFYYGNKFIIKLVNLKNEAKKLINRRLEIHEEKVRLDIKQREEEEISAKELQELQKLEDLLTKLDQKSEESEKLLEELRSASKSAEKNLKQLEYATIITTVFSIFLMLFGFFFWYTKIQKYQDIIIKNQAENIQSLRINKADNK